MNKILVIDDDHPTLDAIKLLFEMENYDVIGRDNCLDLNDLLRSFKPDIILIDIIMGSVDGRDVCRELKESEYKYIPVILMSVIYGFDKDLSKPLSSDDFIDKPFDLELMLSKVHALVNSSQTTVIDIATTDL